MKKLINILFLIIASTTFIACGGEDDPQPVPPSQYEALKAKLTGTWTFQSVTVTQTSTGKSGSVSDCNGSTLNSVFSTTYFNGYKPVINYTFESGTDVKVLLPCFPDSSQFTWTLKDNGDNTFTFEISNGRKWFIKGSDVTDNSIKATDLSSFGTSGYTGIYTYVKGS